MGFQCQQFYIKDDQCAMKVSTDSLLLGSYVPVTGVKRALDMGTGSGLLALMIAQRAAQAQVDAFDADLAAVAQAQENVAQSPWPERVRIASSCVSQWQAEHSYDLIVCNPPYFALHFTSLQSSRELARQGSVSPEQWLACAARSLRADGKLYWVLPLSQAQTWQALAEHYGFNLCDELTIQTTVQKPAKLTIQGWKRGDNVEVSRKSLTIHAPEGGYSRAFRNLTGEFYLAGGAS